ncbi:MAG: flagellar motor switch protein FliN [Planctomycetota bacterium]|nr:flagellar motor switch protein FliN [Planctomycetota bacterium]
MPENDAKNQPAAGPGRPDQPQAGQGPSDAEIDGLLKELGLGSAPAPKAAPPKGDEAVDDIIAELAATEKKAPPPPADAKPLKLEAFDRPSAPVSENKLGLIMDVNLHLKVELGRTKMFIRDVLKLGKGAVVELDKLAGDPLEVFVNDKLVAKGEVLILNDNFCVRITEIVPPKQNK